MNEQGQVVEAGFAELFAESSLRLKEGEVVEGVVLAITDDHVQVDVGFKSEGLVDAWEFMEEDGSFTVKPGDRVDVFVEETEDLDGHIVLSKEKANRLKIWDGISSAYEAGDPVEGRILSRVKGGLSVDLGVKAFLPGSQVDLRPVGNLESLIGERMQFKIIKFNKRRGNIVLSRRVLLEKEREQMRATTLQSLEEGMIADGMVKNITDYGAFVDLGGIDGLLHVTDMSWGRINHPSELFKPGDELKVKVLKFDSDSERVSLGLKQIQPDPWVDAAMRYPVGMRVEGRVVSLTDYGAFVELEPGVEGLVHVSEMSWTKRVKHPGKVVSIGDEVQAVVLGVEEGNRRLSLGMKQTEPNPWDVIEEKYPLGTRVQGEVRSVTNFGLFVGLEEGIDGLVHVSDLSWTENIKHPGEKFEKGSQVEAVVLKIDRDNEKFSLGIKQLTENPWDQIQRRYPLGSEVNCEVSSVADFGVFVKLEEGIEGLIYAAELRAEADAEAEAAEAEVKPGDQLTALVTRVDPVDQKIALSVKAASDARQRAELEKLAQQQAQAQKKTIGDLLKEKLAARKAPEQPDSEG